jgi:N-acetylglucosamine malate deacetylase 1
MKLDLLAFAAHPDDAELGCGGTLAAEAARGRHTGIVDLTLGELGTRGTPETRMQEALAAGNALGLRVRRNLGLADGFFRNDPESQLAVIRQLRDLQPDVVLCNAPEDRHPDHGRAAQLVSEACFLSGLRRIETTGEDGQPQAPWRPRLVYHYIQDRLLTPDFIVDISAHWATKLEGILAYRSQFFDPSAVEPNTYISSPEFLRFLESRSREMGHLGGFELGEGFIAQRKVGVKSIADLV